MSMPTAADGAAAVDADGNVLISGRLELDTVPALAAQGQALFSGRTAVTVDLAAVDRGESAGLALLLEWQRSALAAGCVVTYRNVPASLRSIATACGVDEVLALDAD
jgi:phospholipid transport system transporter-binding protein